MKNADHIIKRIIKHLQARRQYNRVKRWMRERAEGRLIIALHNTGMINRRP